MNAMADGGYMYLIPTCPICWEEYKEPKVLACGHSFCCQCLTNCMVRSNNNYYRYLPCPTCKTKVRLPRSGRVEDFTTNYDLMNLTSDRALNQNRLQARVTSSNDALDPRRFQTEAHSSKRKRGDDEDHQNSCHCQQHINTLKDFYCKSCRMQVCSKCLLEVHKPDKHCIISAKDMIAHLSDHLQKSMTKLQCLQKERRALQDIIAKARQNCQNDAQKQKNIIQEILQKEKNQLQRAADDMFSAINVKTEACEHTYNNLEQQLYHLHTPFEDIRGHCSILNQHFQKYDLSLAGELKKTDEHIEYVISCIDSLKTTCESTPTNVGLSVNESKHTKLGIKLSESFSNNPMIMQTDD